MNFLKHKKDIFFVSSIDRFLEEFDHTHAKTASQQAEIEKYQRVFALRDGVKMTKNSEKRKHETA